MSKRNGRSRRRRPAASGPLPACTTRADRDAEMPDSGTRHLPGASDGLGILVGALRSGRSSDGLTQFQPPRESDLVASESPIVRRVSDDPRGTIRPCPHHSSINWPATGSAGWLITGCTAMTSIASPSSKRPSDTPGCTSRTTWPVPSTGRDAAASASDRPLVPGRPGRRRADDPARSSRLRAAAARRVVGRRPAVAAALPQADPRAPGRPSPRAPAASSFAARLTIAGRRAHDSRARLTPAARPESRTPPGCRPRRNSGGRPAGRRSASGRRGSARIPRAPGG